MLKIEKMFFKNLKEEEDKMKNNTGDWEEQVHSDWELEMYSSLDRIISCYGKEMFVLKELLEKNFELRKIKNISFIVLTMIFCFLFVALFYISPDFSSKEYFDKLGNIGVMIMRISYSGGVSLILIFICSHFPLMLYKNTKDRIKRDYFEANPEAEKAVKRYENVFEFIAEKQFREVY